MTTTAQAKTEPRPKPLADEAPVLAAAYVAAAAYADAQSERVARLEAENRMLRGDLASAREQVRILRGHLLRVLTPTLEPWPGRPLQSVVLAAWQAVDADETIRDDMAFAPCGPGGLGLLGQRERYLDALARGERCAACGERPGHRWWQGELRCRTCWPVCEGCGAAEARVHEHERALCLDCEEEASR